MEPLTAMPYPGQEIWFLTGSQGLYGEETLHQVAEQSRQIADALDAAGEIPVRIVWKPVLTDADAIRRIVPRGQRRRRLRRRDRLDAHLLAGQDVDRRTGRAAQAAAAPAHPGQRRRCPGPTIDMDFMNLNQAAHGDREFGYIQSRLRRRRKTVAGHVDRPARRAAIGAWARAAAGRHGRADLRLARFGDNMRDVAVTEGDKVEAQMRFGVSVNTYGVNDLVAVVDAVERRRGRRAGRRVRRALRRRARAAPRRRPARVAALRRADRARPARLPRRGRLQRLHHQLRGPRRPAPAARPGRPAADGRRLRLRRRGRLEDLRPAAHAEGRWPPGRPAAPRFMEDYTYHLAPARRAILGAHMLEVCPSHRRRPAARARSTRWASAAGRTRSAWSSTPRPGPAVVVGLADMGDRFRLIANEIDVVAPDEPLPQPAGRPRRLEARPTCATSAEAWLTAGGPHHTVLTLGGRHRGAHRLRRHDPAPNSWRSTRHHDPRVRARKSAGTRPTTASPRPCDTPATDAKEKADDRTSPRRPAEEVLEAEPHHPPGRPRDPDLGQRQRRRPGGGRLRHQALRRPLRGPRPSTTW